MDLLGRQVGRRVELETGLQQRGVKKYTSGMAMCRVRHHLVVARTHTRGRYLRPGEDMLSSLH